MDELKKYEIDGMVADQIMSEMNENIDHAVMTESQTIPQSNTGTYTPNLNYAIRKVIAESLLGEHSDTAFDGVPAIGSQAPEKTPEQKKFDKVQGYTRIINDMIYRLRDCGYRAEPDAEIDAAVKAHSRAVLSMAVDKLYAEWHMEEKIEAPAEPEEPAGRPAQGITLVLQKNEKIKAPTGAMYIVDDIINDKAKLFSVTENKTFMVDLEIAKKWKAEQA